MIGGLIRVGVSLALLAFLAWWLDTAVVLDRLASFDPWWALVAVAISLPQMALLAFRWRFTAAKIGLDQPLSPSETPDPIEALEDQKFADISTPLCESYRNRFSKFRRAFVNQPVNKESLGSVPMSP